VPDSSKTQDYTDQPGVKTDDAVSFYSLWAMIKIYKTIFYYMIRLGTDYLKYTNNIM